jgi:Aminoglycoside-2''-adenylyltransferase
VEAGTDQPAPLVNSPIEASALLRVCSLLNKAGTKYLIAGAYAMTLHSIIRATEDVDILIEDSMENFRRVIEGLSNLADGAARQLKPEDLAENAVVKIADEVEVDVTTKAWTVTYAEAIENARSAIIGGVQVPYLSLQDLIRSKQTYREQDRADVERLRRLLP